MKRCIDFKMICGMEKKNDIRKNADSDMRELTRAELEVMQIMWSREKVLVHDILDSMDEPKPAYNTVSTIVRILEKKGFVSHKSYGKTYEYFPLVSKKEYTQQYMKGVLKNFFGGSVSSMVSFFASDRSISAEETDEILDILNRKQ